MRQLQGKSFPFVACLMVIPYLAAASPGVFADGTYNVQSGKVVTTPPGISVMLVERFAMEDESRLVVSQDTSLFIIRAEVADIGNDTSIFGQGRDGPAATAAGGDGEPGTHGPTIFLIAEQADIRGLNIVALGGNGGAGGKGKTGSEGYSADCTNTRSSTSGGRGRPGGDGGVAGDGGKIFVVLPADTGSYGIGLNVNPGEPGDLGLGGDGGPGGRGRDCGFWRRGSASNGERGENGTPGTRGRRGMIRWVFIEDFEPVTISDQLKGIVSSLRANRFMVDAAAIEEVLDSGVLVNP